MKENFVEFHVHLEGTIRAETATALARKVGVPVPAKGPFTNFNHFVSQYVLAKELVKDVESVAMIAREFAEDQDRRGVVYTELSVSPDAYAIESGSPEDVLRAVIDSLPRDRFGVVVVMQRTKGAGPGWDMTNLAIKYAGQGVVGLGLSGFEPEGPAQWYRDHFQQAKSAGLKSLPHAGETEGATAIWDTLKHLKPDRIGHGIRAVEDPALMTELAERGITLDLCLTSNVYLGFVPTFKAHPVHRLLAFGIPVTLSSDITYLLDTDVGQEYRRAVEECGVTPSAIQEIARHSLAQAPSIC